MNKWVFKILLAIFSIGSVGLIVGVTFFILAFYHFGKDLPDYKKLREYRPPIMTRLYGGDGTLIAEYATEKRIFVPIHAIPKHVIYAFLSAEDKNFFAHKGVDFYGIMRAALNNLNNIRKGQRLEGASTITQQVAKNFLLTNEVSIERKIKEAMLSFRMEQTFTKQHILELYMNEIFLGNRSYGVAAAALNYFNKSLDELSISEAALLAALPKAPSAFDPFRNPERALERRNWVITRMQEDGRISRAQAEQARLQPIDLERRDRTEFVNARFFAEDIRRLLVSKYGDDVIYLGGLSVRTTLDPKLQNFAVTALRDGLEDYDRRWGYRGPVGTIQEMDNWQKELAAYPIEDGYRPTWRRAVVLKAGRESLEIGLADGSTGTIPLKNLSWARKCLRRCSSVGEQITAANQVAKRGDVIFALEDKDKKGTFYLRQIPDVQGAIVALDPHTGRVLAMQGGYKADISGFNRATQAKRQPGSAFKPFIYLAALDSGFTPSSIVLDAPIVFEQGPGLPKWKPTNYSNEFYGPTTLRVGLEKSRNLMTVRLAHRVGMDKIAEYAKKFGIDPKMQRHLAMSLGAGETTLMDMVAGYAVFVNGGKKIEPTLVDRIQDRDGNTIYKKDERECEQCEALMDWTDQETPLLDDEREAIADPLTSYQMVSILEGVVQRGTGTALKSLNRPLAGKTGTTNDSKDSWFIGFTPDLAVGVYVGFDEPRSLGKRETGASIAVPIFKQFMEQALKDEPVIPFRVPSGLNMVRVNAQTGRPAQAGDTQVIWESFLPGTEPGATSYTPDTSGLNLMSGQDSTSVKDSANVGTGGLY